MFLGLLRDVLFISKTWRQKGYQRLVSWNTRGPDSPLSDAYLRPALYLWFNSPVCQKASAHWADRGCIQFCHPLTPVASSQSLPTLSGLFVRCDKLFCKGLMRTSH